MAGLLLCRQLGREIRPAVAARLQAWGVRLRAARLQTWVQDLAAPVVRAVQVARAVKAAMKRPSTNFSTP